MQRSMMRILIFPRHSLHQIFFAKKEGCSESRERQAGTGPIETFDRDQGPV